MQGAWVDLVLSVNAVRMVLVLGSGALAWSGCSSVERPATTAAGSGGSSVDAGAGSGGDRSGASGAGGFGATAGTSNPRTCFVHCIARRYCEDGVVYRVSRASSAAFPCGTLPPPLECTAHPLEQCEHGCDEDGLECADAGGSGSAGTGGQGGQGGETNGGDGSGG
jgi:hypothetical protein